MNSYYSGNLKTERLPLALQESVFEKRLPCIIESVAWDVGFRGPRAALMARPNAAAHIIRSAEALGAGEKAHDLKRHILTDLEGRRLTVDVHVADSGSGWRQGGPEMFPCRALCAGGGYADHLVGWYIRRPMFALEIVRLPARLSAPSPGS